MDAADRVHLLAVRGRDRRAEALGLDRAGDAIVEAIKATNLDTLTGKVQWGADPALGPISANVCKTPLVGGQWRRNDDNTFNLVVVDNSHAPEIPAGGTMEALPA